MIPWNEMKRHPIVTLIDPPPFHSSVFNDYTFERLNVEYLNLDSSVEYTVVAMSCLRVSTLDVSGLPSIKNFNAFRMLRADELRVGAAFNDICQDTFTNGISAMKVARLLIKTMCRAGSQCNLHDETMLEHLQIDNLEVTIECDYHFKKWHHKGEKQSASINK
jgi:hypothetical protein